MADHGRVEVGRARLLFTVEQHANAPWDVGLRGQQTIERGEERDDRALVVRRRSPVDAHVRIDGSRARGQIDRRLADEGLRAERAAKGPLLRIGGLAIVVHVKEHGAPRVGDVAAREDDRRAFGFPARHPEPAFLEHGGEQVGVLRDVRAIRGQVGHRDELHQPGEDLPLVPRAPLAYPQHVCGRRGYGALVSQGRQEPGSGVP